MSRSVSSNAMASMFASQTDQVYLYRVKIDHTDLGSPIRLVNNTVSITSESVVWSPANFRVTPPVEEDGTIKSASITLGNIDRVIVETIRSISSAPTVELSIIRAAEPDVIEAGPWEFSLRGVSYDVEKVSGELVPDNPLQRYASVKHYRNTTFPGLYG